MGADSRFCLYLCSYLAKDTGAIGAKDSKMPGIPIRKYMLKKPLVNPLRKVLGVAFGLAVVVGSTIGVGILRTPASIAALVPDARIIIACWIAIGFYIILSASSYAELTTMLPKAGGAYNYIKRAFGGYAGFLNGWFDLISNAM